MQKTKKSLMKEIKEDLNKWRDTLCLCFEDTILLRCKLSSI